jgi:hypothetical protein
VLSPATTERLYPARARLRLTPAPGTALRLVAVAALLALLATAALTVGAELLRTRFDQDLVVVPPAPTATIAESTDAPAASPLIGAAWRSLGLPEPMKDQQVEALAPNGSRGLIAGGCVQPSFGAGCTDAAVWLSASGADWSDPVLLPGPDGEDEGPVRVIASSADQLIAAGVVDRDDVRFVALWASADGTSWTRAPDDPSFEAAEVLQIERIGRRWVAIGSGSFGEPAGFRAWTSEDGLAWTRADFPASTDSAYPTSFVLVDEGLLAAGPTSSVSAKGTQWWESPDEGPTWQPIDSPSGLEAVTISWLQPATDGPIAYGRHDAVSTSASAAWTRTLSAPDWFPDNETTDPSGEVVQPGGRIGPAITVGQGTVAVVTAAPESASASIWYRQPSGLWKVVVETGAEPIDLVQHPTEPQRLFLVVSDVDGRHAIWTGEVDWTP